MHPGGVDAGVEGERGQDGELLRRVYAFDVEGRIGFRVAEALRFRQGVREAAPVLFHGGENVVRRAVDDARQRIDAVGGKPRAQRIDDGNAACHRRLEAERQAAFTGGGEEFVAAGREQRLVGGDDVLASGDGVFHQRLGNALAADQFNQHIDVVAGERTQFGVEGGGAEGYVRLRGPACGAHQLDWATGAGRNGVAVLDQKPGDAAADRAKSGQPDSKRRQSANAPPSMASPLLIVGTRTGA